jgi:RNA polymerase sigma-70 factor (ECF subfamily)
VTPSINHIEYAWEKLHLQLKSFILSKVRDNAVADDILQEVFIKAHSKIESLRERDKMVPWLYQIARNQVLDYFRSQKKEQKLEDQLTEADEDTSHLASTMQTAVRDMIGMMDDLPPEYCEALCAIELEGISQVAYAEKSGIPYSTVKSRVQRARHQLRDMMMKCCHYQFDRYGTVLAIKPAQCCCCSEKKK